MTPPPPNTGQGSNPTNGANDADAKAKAKVKSEANKEKKKKRKQREKERKNTNNYVKYDGLIKEGIMKEATISPGSSARMTSVSMIFKKSLVVYVEAKGYKH